MSRDVELTVNGVRRRLQVPDDERLLEVLRRDFGCTSVREGCGVGMCGACTALVDGRSVSSCLVRAARCHDAEITTADGLPEGDDVVAAFVDCDAVQCGYCIPGFVLMTHELLTEKALPSSQDIVDHLEGNICRCGTYQEIRAAVETAARRRNSQEAVS